VANQRNIADDAERTISSWLRSALDELKKRWPLIVIAVVAVGVWLLKRDIDTFLTVAIAAGAFVAAYFAFEQTKMTGRAIANADQALAFARGARQQETQPHLVVGNVGVESRPNGLRFSAAVLNNGQGAALEISLKFAVAPGPRERPLPPYDAFPADGQFSAFLASVGPASSRSLRRTIPVPRSLESSFRAKQATNEWSLTLYWWAEFDTTDGRAESDKSSVTVKFHP